MFAGGLCKQVSLYFIILPARSSSNHGDHSAGEAVDGLVTRESCWWSRPSVNSWWSVDLGGDTFIRKIRIYNAVSDCNVRCVLQ